jgi:zinc transporter 1
LIALCLTIILEAITRFVDPPVIKNPMLILIVGSLGLASNLAGFFVLGGHGHSHGPGEEHGHSHGNEIRAAEEGHSHSNAIEETPDDSDSAPGSVFPEAVVAKAKSGQRIRFTRKDEDASTMKDSHGSLNRSWSKASSQNKHRRRTSGRFTSIDDISIHPASFRQDILRASRAPLEGIESGESTASEEEAIADGVDTPTENSPLIYKSNGKTNGNSSDEHNHNDADQHRSHAHSTRPRHNSLHVEHNHNKPKKPSKGGHGHNHGDMGMNAMILHVIGDALGNVGVIVTALIIWLTTWSGRFYADPAVSLFITLIILKSAIPLTSATAKILLQATPDHIDVNDIKEDIQNISGVISCHHVHIWQLSDTQIVASMHIQVAFQISEASGEKYMELARAARACLHAYGIHSATLQPEFCLDEDHDHFEGTGLDGVVGQPRCRLDDDCLLECVDNCEAEGCCPAPATEEQHDHSDHEGHSH